MPEEEYPIRATFYEHQTPFATFPDVSSKATWLAELAQVCGYGITLEVIEEEEPHVDSVDADC
jgi:hypothetical protein